MFSHNLIHQVNKNQRRCQVRGFQYDNRAHHPIAVTRRCFAAKQSNENHRKKQSTFGWTPFKLCDVSFLPFLNKIQKNKDNYIFSPIKAFFTNTNKSNFVHLLWRFIWKRQVECDKAVVYVVLPDTVFAVVGGDGAAQAIGVLLAVLQHIVSRVSAEVMGLATSSYSRNSFMCL